MWTKQSLVGLLLWSAVALSNNNAANVMADEDVLAEVLSEEVPAAEAKAAAEEENQGQSPPVADTTDEAPPKVDEKVKAKTTSFDAKDHTDWGSYYDPQNVFCGKFDCYKILGFDYESFGSNRPDTKVITKRYRNLSREWHPDKSKHKDAKNRFVVGT
jgi:DnaJ family protein C protein 25